jgi:hypothetical protein
MSRPIPFKRIETFFWTCNGENPEWFVNDAAPVDTCQLPNIQLGLEWMQRRRDRVQANPRVVAPDETGAMFWLHEQHGAIRLNAFGNPDFAYNMPAY